MRNRISGALARRWEAQGSPIVPDFDDLAAAALRSMIEALEDCQDDTHWAADHGSSAAAVTASGIEDVLTWLRADRTPNAPLRQ